MKKILTTIFAFLLIFSLGLSVYAQAQPNTNTQEPNTNTQEPNTNTNEPNTNTQEPVSIGIELTNPFKVGDNLFDLLRAVVNNILLPIGGVLAVLAFIYSGFLYVMAQGNETKLQTAHRALLYTSIGTAVLLGSWVIANVIKNTIESILP